MPWQRRHLRTIMMKPLSGLSRLWVAGAFAVIATAATAKNQGFVDTGGTFRTLDIPGASSTIAAGINNTGQIVGWFDDSKGQHGFLHVGGTFSTIDVPGARVSS